MLYGFMKLPKIVVYSYTLLKVRFYVTILFQMKQSVICSPLLPCNFFLFKQLHDESMRNFTFTKISSKMDSFVQFHLLTKETIYHSILLLSAYLIITSDALKIVPNSVMFYYCLWYEF